MSRQPIAQHADDASHANHAGHAGPRLSVAIVARDDAEGLAATLASVAAVADERVVLDAMSQDGTADVARQHGARLIERAWDDDFAAARNACLHYTTGDWVLWLDSGERLAGDSAQQIRKLIAEEDARGRAYRVTVRVPPPSAEAQAEQIAPVRLVPRQPELRFVGRVRESLAEALMAGDIEVHGSSLLVERDAREHDPQRKLMKARRDLRLAQRDLADRGNCAALLLAKGEAFAALGDRAEAIDMLRMAIAGATRGSAIQLAAYGALLATLDGLENPGQDTLGVRIALGLEALEVFPLDAQLLMAMGGYLQAQGQIELAARSFRVAWEHGAVMPDVWHVVDARSLAASCLSLMLQMLGRDEEAVEVLEASLAGALDEQRLRRRLLEIHVRHARRDAALSQVERLAPAAEQARFRAAIRGACLAAAGDTVGAIAQLESAYRQGCRDVLCRRSYVNALLATRQQAKATAVLDEWLAAEPNNAEALRLLAAARGDAAQRHAEPITRRDAPHADTAIAPSSSPRTPQPAVGTDARIDAAPAQGAVIGPTVGPAKRPVTSIDAPHTVPPPRLPTDATAPSHHEAPR